MAAYVVVDAMVKDPVRYDDYRKRVIATLEPYGGKFLVRGGKWKHWKERESRSALYSSSSRCRRSPRVVELRGVR